MEKYKVGYTTGVFDMFHIGHLNVLKNAKKMCDYLIVGVSTDELVKSYKNKCPIIPFEERKRIVESICYVDEVISQCSLEKSETCIRYKVNVVFHGDDWKNSQMYNKTENELNKIGVKMVYLPHTDGISSSILRSKIDVKNKCKNICKPE